MPLKSHRSHYSLITQPKVVLILYSQEDKNTFPLGFYNIEQEIKLEIWVRVMSGTGLLVFPFLSQNTKQGALYVYYVCLCVALEGPEKECSIVRIKEACHTSRSLMLVSCD